MFIKFRKQNTEDKWHKSNKLLQRRYTNWNILKKWGKKKKPTTTFKHNNQASKQKSLAMIYTKRNSKNPQNGTDTNTHIHSLSHTFTYQQVQIQFIVTVAFLLSFSSSLTSTLPNFFLALFRLHSGKTISSMRMSASSLSPTANHWYRQRWQIAARFFFFLSVV